MQRILRITNYLFLYDYKKRKTSIQIFCLQNWHNLFISLPCIWHYVLVILNAFSPQFLCTYYIYCEPSCAIFE